MVEESYLKSFYANKEIFVTGGSGFVGKALIEKLLRSCPDVKKIYVLMRTKKGMTIDERRIKLIENIVFDVLRKIEPNFHQKLELIEGDCIDIGLGISDKDLQKLRNVSIIFHSAASIRFDDPLKKAILLNTRGTREVCNFAESLVNLESVVHVSTAYVNPRRKEMKETIYETSFDWQQYIKFAENLKDDEILETLSAKLTKNAVNTYVFTKNMAEHVCLYYQSKRNLPVCIVRPSIITCSEIDPYPGWMDPYNGPIMFIFGFGSGLCRTILSRSDHGIDCIPVDIVVKCCIIAAWKKWRDLNISKAHNKMDVYNCTSMKFNSIAEIKVHGFRCCSEVPFKYALWKPGCVDTTSLAFSKLCVYFLQLLPAIFLDFIIWIIGKKPIVMKTQRKIWSFMRAVDAFLENKINFYRTEFHGLKKELSKSDQKEFHLNETIPHDWDYFLLSYKSAMKITFNQTDEESKAAWKRFQVYKVLDILINATIIGYLCYFIYNLF